MKIIVTGAAGFVGSHLAEHLARSGHAVVGVDAFLPYYDPALKQRNAEAVKAAGVTMMTSDLTRDNLGPVLAGADYVIHLAAQPGISATTPFQDYVDNNLHATHRLLTAVQATPGIRGLVNIATSSVYGADATCDETRTPQPTSWYGVTKLAAEQLVLAAHRERKIAACSLRLYSVYGPRERPEKAFPRLLRAGLENTPFPLYEGSEHHLRSFTYVEDAVQGIVRAMERFEACAGEIFNIGTSEVFSTGAAIATVEEILGRKVPLQRAPRRPGDQQQTRAVIDKARAVLSYAPATTLRQGLEQEVRWMRELLATPRSAG